MLDMKGLACVGVIGFLEEQDTVPVFPMKGLFCKLVEVFRFKPTVSVDSSVVLKNCGF